MSETSGTRNGGRRPGHRGPIRPEVRRQNGEGKVTAEDRPGYPRGRQEGGRIGVSGKDGAPTGIRRAGGGDHASAQRRRHRDRSEDQEGEGDGDGVRPLLRRAQGASERCAQGRSTAGPDRRRPHRCRRNRPALRPGADRADPSPARQGRVFGRVQGDGLRDGRDTRVSRDGWHDAVHPQQQSRARRRERPAAQQSDLPARTAGRRRISRRPDRAPE